MSHIHGAEDEDLEWELERKTVSCNALLDGKLEELPLGRFWGGRGMVLSIGYKKLHEQLEPEKNTFLVETNLPSPICQGRTVNYWRVRVSEAHANISNLFTKKDEPWGLNGELRTQFPNHMIARYFFRMGMGFAVARLSHGAG